MKAPDFSKYGLVELYQSLRTIDREQYPERLATIQQRIAELEASEEHRHNDAELERKEFNFLLNWMKLLPIVGGGVLAIGAVELISLILLLIVGYSFDIFTIASSVYSYSIWISLLLSLMLMLGGIGLLLSKVPLAYLALVAFLLVGVNIEGTIFSWQLSEAELSSDTDKPSDIKISFNFLWLIGFSVVWFSIQSMKKVRHSKFGS